MGLKEKAGVVEVLNTLLGNTGGLLLRSRKLRLEFDSSSSSPLCTSVTASFWQRVTRAVLENVPASLIQQLTECPGGAARSPTVRFGQSMVSSPVLIFRVCNPKLPSGINPASIITVGTPLKLTTALATKPPQSGYENNMVPLFGFPSGTFIMLGIPFKSPARQYNSPLRKKRSPKGK